MSSKQTNNLIKARIIKSQEFVSESNSVEPETSLWGNVADLYEPPYRLEYLLRLPESSNILGECIDSYVNNIPGFGWEVISIIDTNTQSKDDNKTKEAHHQKEEVEFFLNTCNYKESFVSLMKMVVKNRETCGIGYLEVLTNTKGEPAGFEVIRDPSKVRIIRPDGWVNKDITYNLDSGTRTKTLPTKFYKFVLEDGTVLRYFKEFGDTRMMDKDTGDYNNNVSVDRRASSLIPFRLACSYSPYGLPRYIGKIPCIVGSRSSEELNISYFQNGRVVPAAVVVENGKLSSESYEVISGTKGVDQSFKWLLLEASGEQTDEIIEGDNKSNAKIHIKPLTELIQNDGLFQEYDANNRSKIRSSYRVPPIYTGESSDYTKSTAQIARAVAEALVFQPEREEVMYPINRLFREMGYNLVEVRFKAPKLTDKFELSKALIPYVNSGTATPNMLLESLGELLNRRFDPIAEYWGDKPIQLVMKEIDQKMLVQQVVANNQTTSDIDDIEEQANKVIEETNDDIDNNDVSIKKEHNHVKSFLLDIIKVMKDNNMLDSFKKGGDDNEAG